MTQQEKIQKLEQVLKENGLSFEQDDVRDFFYARRNFLTPELNGSNGKNYTYTSLVKPEKRILTPLDFENSGYVQNKDERLIDWYLFNFGSNIRDSFVPQNIGKDSTKILESFKDSKGSVGVVRENCNGELFGGSDGNHRLLILMINQFIDKMKAKTKEEKTQVNNRYEIELDVNSMVQTKLAYLLNEKYDELNRVVPKMAMEYRRSTFTKNGVHDYICERNANDKTFRYSQNGNIIECGEDELISYLEKSREKQRPIMKWNIGDVYYASCYNKIVMSRSSVLVDNYFNVFNKHLEDKSIENNPFLEIKDLDSNTFDVHTPIVLIEKQDLKRKVAAYQEGLLDKDNEKVFLNKLTNADDVYQRYWEEIYSVKNNASWPMMIRQRVYRGLNKDEFNELIKLLQKESKLFNINQQKEGEPEE